MPIGDLLPEILVLLGAMAIILMSSFTPHRWQYLNAWLGLGILAAASVLTLLQANGVERLTFSGVWALDQAAVFAKVLILVSGGFVVALSPRWMATDRRHGEYYALILFSLLGAIMMVSAADSMELLIGVLLSSITGYVLAAYHRDWSPALEAGMKYFLLGALANAFLAIGVVLLFGLTGMTGYPEIESALQPATNQVGLVVALAFILLGLMFKMGAFPLHAWLPDVAQGAPAPVAALLTLVPKIAAAMALIRVVDLLPEALNRPWIIAGLSALTMTLGNLAAFWQTDLRRLLGWSAVSQSGYALMAIVVVNHAPEAQAALLYFLTAYACANMAVFAAVTYLRGRTALTDYRGLIRAHPWTVVVMVLALLSFVGIPPLAGFFGKVLLFKASIEGGYAWLSSRSSTQCCRCFITFEW